MKRTRIIANYLPQFHEIPENNQWWGRGYTDWTAVKNSKPLYDGHQQPRVPSYGYYKLDEKVSIAWQAQLARSHGVDALGIYHYWFSSEKMLLERPAEILLDSPEIDIGFMFIWDNASWCRTWSNIKHGNDWSPRFEAQASAKEKNEGILVELKYGNEADWEKHFNYLLPFFKDSRYVKVDDSPVFCLFNQDNEPDILRKMVNYWNELAKKNGFNGVHIIGQQKYQGEQISKYSFVYQPSYHGWYVRNFPDRVIKKICREVHFLLKKPLKFQYDHIWKRIIRFALRCDNKHIYYSAFVGYDDTPRRGNKGTIVENGTPEKFKNYFTQLLKISNAQEKAFVFIVAWNEWGEGAYLEPDTQTGLKYLEALASAASSIACNCDEYR